MKGRHMKKTHGDTKKTKSTAHKVETKANESFNQQFVNSSLASTHRLITRKLSATSLAGVYLTQDKCLSPPPPPPQSLPVAISPPPLQQILNSVNEASSNALVESVVSTIAVKAENDQELQNILSVVQSKITSLEETVNGPQAKDTSVADEDINGKSSAIDRREPANTRQIYVDSNNSSLLSDSTSAMNAVIRTIVQSGKSSRDNSDHNILANNDLNSIKKVEEKEHVEDNLNAHTSKSIRSNKKGLTPMKIGDLSSDSPSAYSKSIGIVDRKSPVIPKKKAHAE